MESGIKLDLLHELTRPNALFLSVAAPSESDSVMPIHQWFRDGLTFPASLFDNIGIDVAERVRDHVRDDAGRKQVLVNLLATADVGISDFEVLETQEPPCVYGINAGKTFRFLVGSMAAQMVPGIRLTFRHHHSKELFEFRDESAGTRAWVGLVLDALDAVESGGTMVVDEIDASLHPLLTARLIGLFRDLETNPHGAQLIFTTHDASLLGTALGEEVLARDQIWFVEKDRNGASHLYPLSDFKPREGENRERRYLGGSYGAVPVVSANEFADVVREDR